MIRLCVPVTDSEETMGSHAPNTVSLNKESHHEHQQGETKLFVYI